ncbi:MAG: DegT/DnrJ/EryC1/StrS family aminotransferase [Chlorobiota bacterium]
MQVPFLDLSAQHELLRHELVQAIERVLQTHQFVLGAEVEAFERACQEYLQIPHAVGVSSGTDALLIALMGIGVGPGDEVIVPTWTFFATAGVVARLHARPVFADVESRGFGLQAEAVERVISRRTKAVIVVHLYGQIAPEVEELQRLCEAHGMALVEDAAQAFGACYADGRGVGSFGLCAAISFYPTKNLGACGDSGMVVTRSGEFAKSLRLLRNHGMEQRYLHAVIGGNFRMDAFQAAILRVKLAYLSEWNQRRRALAHRYAELFRQAGLAESPGILEFDPNNRVLLPAELYPDAPGIPHVYHQYVIRARRRDELRQYLAERGVGTEVYYPVPLHRQPAFRELGYSPQQFPVSERLAAEVLALPIYPELSEAQQEMVVGCIESFFRQYD